MKSFTETLHEFCKPLTELEKLKINAALAEKYPIKDLTSKTYKTVLPLNYGINPK